MVLRHGVCHFTISFAILYAHRSATGEDPSLSVRRPIIERRIAPASKSPRIVNPRVVLSRIDASQPIPKAAAYDSDDVSMDPLYDGENMIEEEVEESGDEGDVDTSGVMKRTVRRG